MIIADNLQIDKITTSTLNIGKVYNGNTKIWETSVTPVPEETYLVYFNSYNSRCYICRYVSGTFVCLGYIASFYPTGGGYAKGLYWIWGYTGSTGKLYYIDARVSPTTYTLASTYGVGAETNKYGSYKYLPMRQIWGKDHIYIPQMNTGVAYDSGYNEGTYYFYGTRAYASGATTCMTNIAKSANGLYIGATSGYINYTTSMNTDFTKLYFKNSSNQAYTGQGFIGYINTYNRFVMLRKSTYGANAKADIAYTNASVSGLSSWGIIATAPWSDDSATTVGAVNSAVVFNDYIFAIPYSTSTIYRSYNGLQWTNLDPSSTFTNSKDIMADNNRMYVAAKQSNTRVIYSSTDGVNWTEVPVTGAGSGSALYYTYDINHMIITKKPDL